MMSPATMIAQETENPPGSSMVQGRYSVRKNAAAATTSPIMAPIGRTLSDFLSGMKRAAPIAPSAMPIETTACRIEAWESDSPKLEAPQASTRNCSTAPAPQNIEVTMSEVSPSLSFQSVMHEPMKLQKFLSGSKELFG